MGTSYNGRRLLPLGIVKTRNKRGKVKRAKDKTEIEGKDQNANKKSELLTRTEETQKLKTVNEQPGTVRNGGVQLLLVCYRR